jgi:hypothetical protein
MTDAEIKSKDGAVAPADHIGLGDVQCVQQRDHIISHQVVAVGTGVACAPAMAAAIHHDDSVVRRECLDLVAPIVGVRQAAMQKDDRRTMADGGVVEADAVDFGMAAMLPGHGSGRRRKGLPQRFAVGGLEREKQQQSEQDAAHDELRLGR